MNERYSRQLIMPEIGPAGQVKLRNSSVIVIGAGGLGSPVLLYLAAAGVGVLGIVDDDRITLSNLNRQVLYTVNDIECSKSLIAAQRIQALNPEVQTRPVQQRISYENGIDLVEEFDVVVDASDNLATKSLLNEWCVKSKVPLVWAAVSRFEGQLGTYVPDNACRACIFPKNPEPGTYPSPAELGVVGAAAGVMGTLQALEVLKILLQIGKPLVNKILLFDGLHSDFDILTFTRHPTCPVCG
jgi:adenylyltransferase/sulfurtransferase